MHVEGGRDGSTLYDLVEACDAACEREYLRSNLQNHARAAALLHPGHHADELEGVAETLLVVDQQGPAVDASPIPTGPLHHTRDPGGMRHIVAPVVFAPAALE